MKLKKLLALTLSVFLALSCVTIPAFATATVLTSSDSEQKFKDGGEFVVNSNITCDTIVFRGNATLTVNEGCTLTLNANSEKTGLVVGGDPVVVSNLTIRGSGTVIINAKDGETTDYGSEEYGAPACFVGLKDTLTIDGVTLIFNGGDGEAGEDGQMNAAPGKNNYENGKDGYKGGHGIWVQGTLIVKSGNVQIFGGKGGAGGAAGKKAPPYNTIGTAGNKGEDGEAIKNDGTILVSSGLFNVDMSDYADFGYECVANSAAATKTDYPFEVKALPNAYLDLEEGDTYLDSKDIDQQFDATVSKGTRTDVTKVRVSWKLEAIEASVSVGKKWNPDKLSWEDDTATSSATATAAIAVFNFENLSSVKVFAQVTFAVGSNYTAVTPVFGDASETANDGVVYLDTVATDPSTANNTDAVTKQTVKVTVTPVATDFKQLTESVNNAVYGKYTVKLSSGDPTKCTITFDKQGGTGGTDSIQITKGGTLTTITPPTKDGYTFLGYFTGTGATDAMFYKADGTANVTDKMDADKTLYAQWEAATCMDMYNHIYVWEIKATEIGVSDYTRTPGQYDNKFVFNDGTIATTTFDTLYGFTPTETGWYYESTPGTWAKCSGDHTNIDDYVFQN